MVSPVLLQQFHAIRSNAQASLASSGFRCVEHKAYPGDGLDRPLDGERPLLKVNVRPAQGTDLTPPGTKQQGQLSDHTVLRRCIRESIQQRWNLFLRQYPNVDFLGFGMFCTGARVLVDQSPLDTFLKDAGEHGLVSNDAVVVQLPVLFGMLHKRL